MPVSYGVEADSPCVCVCVCVACSGQRDLAAAGLAISGSTHAAGTLPAPGQLLRPRDGRTENLSATNMRP